MIDRQTGQNPLPSLTSLRAVALYEPEADLRPPWLAGAIWRRRLTSGFTLIELLVVIGVIILLTALLTPAFTNLKSAGDVTSAAYTVKGVLEQARTYAKANNTYTWVGFYEENVSQPSPNSTTPKIGRVVMSVVASTDGTIIYTSSSPGTIDPTRLLQVSKLTKIDNVHLATFTDGSGAGSTFATRPAVTFNGTQYRIGDTTKLIQLNKLVKIDNVHLPLFTIGSSTGSTFDTRPALQNDPVVGYNDSRFGELNGNPTAPTTNAKFPFQYPVGKPAPAAQYTFTKTLQFNPRGEGRINSTYDVRRVIEIGLIPTHQNVAPTPTPSAGNYGGNVVAIQLNGFAGNVKIYRR